MSLYTNPSVKVAANGESSEAFEIRNGTRQGCPLSPLLFVLTVEHLAQAIHSNNAIHGIPTPSGHRKLSLYAEDLLLYVTQPNISIPALLQELDRFGEHSNFKLNIMKTEALNISLILTTISLVQRKFPFY